MNGRWTSFRAGSCHGPLGPGPVGSQTGGAAQHPTVDEVGRAGHIGRGIRGQIDGQLGDLLRPAQAPERDNGQQLLQQGRISPLAGRSRWLSIGPGPMLLTVIRCGASSTTLGHRLRHQRLDLVGLRDIGPDGDGPASVVCDLPHILVGVVGRAEYPPPRGYRRYCILRW